MTDDEMRALAEIGVRLCDDAYMMWLSAECEAAQLLLGWHTARPSEWRTACAAYQAALDREEAAARDLERLHQVTAPCQEHLRAGSQAAIRTDAVVGTSPAA
jgi:hypothetical protein